MLKVLDVNEVCEYVNGFEFKGEGVYKIKSDEDCNIIECNIIDENDIGYIELILDGEFGIDEYNNEYFRVGV